jgi:Dehydrogenases with different specificities (related to short-chain alcohol dehydrogenases)
MNIVLNGRKALVGGASQGLGKAIAMQLAASGASVTIVARNEEKLKKVLQELPVTEEQQHGYIVADFSDYGRYKAIMNDYFSSHSVDILINNTNGPKAGTVSEQTDADYQAAFSLLFQTVQYTTSLALQAMKEKQYGRIINLTSRTVKEPADNLALSNTIRAAVVAWGKTLARDVGKYNITVNNILTGNFDTERLRELFTLQAQAQNTTLEAITQKAEADIPLQRLGKPEELASLVTFLASEQASYITGTSIPVDGGLLKSI